MTTQDKPRRSSASFWLLITAAVVQSGVFLGGLFLLGYVPPQLQAVAGMIVLSGVGGGVVKILNVVQNWLNDRLLAEVAHQTNGALDARVRMSVEAAMRAAVPGIVAAAVEELDRRRRIGGGE